MDCHGPNASLRVCHEHLYEHGKADGPEHGEHWCDLKAAHFCWDCCAYFCAIHAVARHLEHRVELIA